MEDENGGTTSACPVDIETLNALMYNQLRKGDGRTDTPLRPPRIPSGLDSIAKLLASQANGDMIATAVQIDEPHQEVILSISSNNLIQVETLGYIHHVFLQLQKVAIARHKHDIRIQKKDGFYLGCLIRARSKNELTPLQSQIRNVHRAVYMFAFDSLIRRILKPLGADSSGLVQLYKCTQDVVTVITYATRPLLLTIRCLLKWVAQNVLQRGKETLNNSRVLSLFLCAMQLLVDAVKQLSENYFMRRELSYIGQDAGFDIYDYLRNVIAIPRSIEILVRYARSRIYSSFFMDKRLRVNIVQTLERSFTLPSTLTAWNTVAQKASHVANIPIPSSMRLSGSGDSSIGSRKSEVKHRIHPECAIALHFLLNRIQNRGIMNTNTIRNFSRQKYIPPISFIGTSTHVCNMCFYFLESLIPATSVIFRVTRSRMDIFPWGFPVVSEEGKDFEGIMMTAKEKSRVDRLKDRIAEEMFRRVSRDYMSILVLKDERGHSAGGGKRKREDDEESGGEGDRVKRGREGEGST
ncbi:hypothetical protein PAAG_12217 [Paracoccidioides lutzii Pb01]|uniref:Uncharacterized protein n=1 Tax=Paracoccidioides lutzii (strain ATCC MYA-826 / Pb01) TaxID=502779 RepID=A0A0A2V4M5_PARBA|nr:hypothetical protein PAAG_12217 [Paracoccidioides lutzii Pb01]KGQ01090.1 hypothetical protein PAAG_12217 [Paracoccidioides lutzii Pb01]